MNDWIEYYEQLSDGHRIHVQLELDADKNVVTTRRTLESAQRSETREITFPPSEPLPPVPEAPAPPAEEDLPASAQAQVAYLRARNIGFTLLPGGSIMIDSIPEKEQQLWKFFLPENPCWFEGCQELRDAYNKDLEAAGGAACTDCDHGALIRRYLPLLREKL